MRKALPALAKGLTFARWVESTTTTRCELYYRQLVAYLICDDVVRAKLALLAAKSFLPAELKV
jgi:hypothetical protein